MRILVAGMVAGDPRQGGATWAVLQYVRGLERLGHEVLLVEPVAALRPDAVDYFASLRLPRAALLVERTGETVGLPYGELAAFGPQVLLNLSGLLRDPVLRAAAPTRVFVDLDPAFVQAWHAQGVDVGLDGHTHFATVGAALAGSGLPLDRRWIPTLPPVVLDEWAPAGDPVRDAFTTVGHWRSYGTAQWRGRPLGQKAHAVRRLLELPRLTAQRLELALAIHPGEHEDLARLADHGWRLLDPADVASGPAAYRDFVRGSKGELGIAKAGYVDSRCGWFSDRSACYLASGRPVVAHDTGFGAVLPTGEGLLAFRSAQEAARALDSVDAGYERHRRAARALAEEHLDARRVLTRLLEAVL